MSGPDIRWQQRLQSFRKAFKRLSEAVQISQARELSELEQQGLIQAFEFTHELAWNVPKDYLDYQGIQGVIGSRGATRGSFQERTHSGRYCLDGNDQKPKSNKPYL